MTGHRAFAELRKTTAPERRAGNTAAVKTMLREMALHELRQAREKSQQDLARDLNAGEPAQSKAEQVK